MQSHQFVYNFPNYNLFSTEKYLILIKKFKLEETVLLHILTNY